MKKLLIIVTLLLVSVLSAFEKKTFDIPMDDGTNLAADIYFPDNMEGNTYPVILNRSPYNREDKEEIGKTLSTNGVIFVAQSVRGRLGSEGIHSVWHSDGWGEKKDGYDTLKWITAQTWCNGKIATIGGSAEGLTQYFMAGLDEKPSLVYQIISIAAGDLYDGVFFPGGMLREHAMTLWLQDQGASFFIEDLMKDNMYSKTNSYWNDTDLFTRKANLTIPATHISGWFDMFTREQIDTFKLYQESSAPDQHLVIGPWSHGTISTSKSGSLTFPENAARYFEGEDDPAYMLLFHYLFPTMPKAALAAVTYYTIGDVSDTSAPGNEWKTSETFPPENAVKVILTADENLKLKKGRCGKGNFVLNFDYANPFPTICGNNLTINPGPCDVSVYRLRKDVISFETEPFDEPTELTGAINVKTAFTTELKDFDLVAVITDIYPDGTEYLMLEGGRKVRFRDGLENEKLIESDVLTEMEFNVGYLSIIFNKGHKMGVHLANAYAPKYRVPSTTENYWDNGSVKGKIDFDISKTSIEIDTIGGWGGTECENIEVPDEDTDDSSETPDEDSGVPAEKPRKSSGCSLIILP